MKAACIVLTIFIGVAIMAVCIMVKFATEITVEEKKREYTLGGGVYELPRAMGVFALIDNTSLGAGFRFPYVAAILRNTSKSWSFACFASIILVKWVITSAHCKKHGAAHRVLLYHDFAQNLSHTYPILVWHLHDKFNLSNPTPKYDLAVAKLNLHHYPFNLKSAVFDTHEVKEVEASVWKTVFSMDRKLYLTNDIDVYNFSVVHFGRCFETYGIEIDESLICVDLSRYDDCFINEFGPVYSEDKIVGVLAIKPRDCDTKIAVFTNISYYVNWILKSTQTTYYGR